MDVILATTLTMIVLGLICIFAIFPFKVSLTVLGIILAFILVYITIALFWCWMGLDL